jgi:GT2 family glycosyltransferase
MLMYRDPNIIDSAGDMLGIARAYKRGHRRQDGTEFNEPAFVFGACAGAALYRREMLADIGLFDETFVTNLEDVDLSFRAQYQLPWYITKLVKQSGGLVGLTDSHIEITDSCG